MAQRFGENRGLIGIRANRGGPKFHGTGINQGICRDDPMEISTEVTHMTSFPVHTIESAPELSKPAMQQLQSAFGMIPNIAGAIATSPALINSLVGLFGNVHGGSFSEPQIQTVLLTDAVVNACTWAVAFHTALALKAGLKSLDVQAIREGLLPADGKLAA